MAKKPERPRPQGRRPPPVARPPRQVYTGLDDDDDDEVGDCDEHPEFLSHHKKGTKRGGKES